jgi:hypothetical protein
VGLRPELASIATRISADAYFARSGRLEILSLGEVLERLSG